MEYVSFVKTLALDEIVRINVGVDSIQKVRETLLSANVNLLNVELFSHPTNDAWCRDYGPDFLVNQVTQRKLILDWKYNCWGEKYPPFHLDNEIPKEIGNALNLDCLKIDFVLEGGSFDVNGDGALLTTESCLLNKNRNPHLSKSQIEICLKKYLKQEEVIWLKEGIIGDDTDGHVDDVARFVSSNQILVASTHSQAPESAQPGSKGLQPLGGHRCIASDASPKTQPRVTWPAG